MHVPELTLAGSDATPAAAERRKSIGAPMPQTAIPCVLMRGGTSKGAYFVASDLPADPALRDRVLLAAFGSPDERQIDGIGGAHPLTSKLAIVSKSARADADIDYLFGQVVVGEPRVDWSPTCGNILAGVGPFALETGLAPMSSSATTCVRIWMANTDSLCEATVSTPGGRVSYSGDARISGAPGTAAPVFLAFADTEGSSCGALLPTGHAQDVVAGVPVTCIDNGMPVVVIEARHLGRTGYESPAELDADSDFKSKLESIRLAAGPLMNLGDVTRRVVPKMTLIAPAREGGTLATRTFIPHVCHDAIGVLGAVSVATACVIEGTVAYGLADGSVAHGLARLPAAQRQTISVEHPTGEFTVELETRAGVQGTEVSRSALLRTARRLFAGDVLIPYAVWDGRHAAAPPAEPQH
jgi:4-oxalomesaconate tautomerase